MIIIIIITFTGIALLEEIDIIQAHAFRDIILYSSQVTATIVGRVC